MVTLRRLKALGAAAILTVTACGALIGIDDRALDTGDFDSGFDSSGGVADTGAKTDGTAATDAPTTDTGPGIVRPLSCGTNPPLVCNAPSETCCISGSSSGNYTYKCTAAGGGCPPGSGQYKLDCIDIEDCAATQYCCGGYNGGGIGTYCKATPCGGGGGEVTTCDRTKTGQCTSGRQCRTSITFQTGSSGTSSFPLPPPLGVCQ
jgi:hypothetical protein